MFKPISLKYSTCLNAVPVLLPFSVLSLTFHTITPPGFSVLASSLAIFWNFSWFQVLPAPLYFLSVSYGGEVTTRSM